jgi:predicted RNA-binding protein YlxR (DUF448 family)
VRLAVADEVIVADPTRRLSGRGAYLCPDRSCLGQALKRGALPRRLRVGADAAAGLEERVGLEAGPGVWEN